MGGEDQPYMTTEGQQSGRNEQTVRSNGMPGSNNGKPTAAAEQPSGRSQDNKQQQIIINNLQNIYVNMNCPIINYNNVYITQITVDP